MDRESDFIYMVSLFRRLRTAGVSLILAVVAGTVFMFAGGAAQAAEMTGFRLGDDRAKTRIVVDLDEIPRYSAVVSDDGKTIRFLMVDTDFSEDLDWPDLKGNLLKDVFIDKEGKNTVVTVVLREVMPHKTFSLANPPRIVLDIDKYYEDSKVIRQQEGLELTEYLRYDERGHLVGYFLDVDPAVYDIRQAIAGGYVSYGCRTVRNIAAENGAVAAVNGGYFNTDGQLIGCSRIDGQTAGTIYYERTSMGFMPDGSMKIDTVGYGAEVTLGDITLPVSGVNCERGVDNLTLYNPLYGNTTDTNEYGTEYIVRNGRVTAIGHGNSRIPRDGVVVSVHGSSEEAFKSVQVGQRAIIEENYYGELSEAQNILGAGPELLRNGRINVTSRAESFPSDISVGKAPRTAIGVKANGHVLMAVIDGRQSHSGGTTLTETAELMKMFGAVNAMNLDGGGSSEMVFKGQVINSPSDGVERRVGSGIVVCRKSDSRDNRNKRDIQIERAEKDLVEEDDSSFKDMIKQKMESKSKEQ